MFSIKLPANVSSRTRKPTFLLNFSESPWISKRRVAKWATLLIVQTLAIAIIIYIYCISFWITCPSKNETSLMYELSMECIFQSPKTCSQPSIAAIQMMENKTLVDHIRRNVILDLSSAAEVEEYPDEEIYTIPPTTTTPRAVKDWDPSSGHGFTSKLLVPVFLNRPDMTYHETFFEAGALNGVYHSTTYYLEKTLGWRGLLAEANPRKTSDIISSGRTSFFAPVCLSPEPIPCLGHFEIRHQAEVQKKAPNWIAWYGRLKQNHSSQKMLSKGFRTSSSPVDCYPLYSLLLAANMTNLDFLSLDLEGMEAHVLTTLPWDKVDIKVIRLDLHNNDVNSEVAVEFLSSQGYTYHQHLVENPYATTMDSHIFSKFVI